MEGGHNFMKLFHKIPIKTKRLVPKVPCLENTPHCWWTNKWGGWNAREGEIIKEE